MKPVFLNTAAAMRIHQQAIARDGGEPGVRDLGLLESALAQPMAMFSGEYLHRDLAEMAAAYLYHLAMNHPFVDGNKRVAAATAGVFIDLNGGALTCGEAEFEGVVLAVARGELDKEKIAEFFRKSIQPPEVIGLSGEE